MFKIVFFSISRVLCLIPLYSKISGLSGTFISVNPCFTSVMQFKKKNTFVHFGSMLPNLKGH